MKHSRKYLREHKLFKKDAISTKPKITENENEINELIAESERSDSFYNQYTKDDLDSYQIVNIIQVDIKRCSVCNHWLPIADFFTDTCSDICKYCYMEWTATKPRKELSKNQIRALSQKYYPERQMCEHLSCKEMGERHHEDYDTYSRIRWLCRTHHMLLHKKLGMGNILISESAP